MELARNDLSIYPKNILDHLVFAIEDDNKVRGFYELRENTNQEAELIWLFVDPMSIGKGYGKMLMQHAIELARNSNFKQMKIKRRAFIKVLVQ